MKQKTKWVPAKGTSRRVVIVRGENDSVFEQIIYIVRDDCVSGKGVSSDLIMREAIQSLDSENEDDKNQSSFLFSRLMLVLVLIVLLLTFGILFYLHFYGWI